MSAPSSDIAFSPAVKTVQSARGSRGAYAKLEARGGFPTTVTPELAQFVAEVDTAYFCTASAEGQPYAQHRGGPPGFIRVLGPTTLGWADFAGNRQYISTGNLSENPRAFLFLMDYARRRRIKLWGRARVVPDDAELIGRLAPAAYAARPEQALIFDIEAWDVNCPQHIPVKFGQAEVAVAVSRLEERIAQLEAENRRLAAALAERAP